MRPKTNSVAARADVLERDPETDHGYRQTGICRDEERGQRSDAVTWIGDGDHARQAPVEDRAAARSRHDPAGLE
jgi:hypothetical protein